MKPVTLTIDLLKSKGACQTALTGLETTHGRMVTFHDPPTLARAIQASGRVSWFAENMLTGTIRSEYERQDTTIRDEYNRQRAPIRAEYMLQRAPIRAEYERQRATTWAEYSRQHIPIRAEYNRQLTPLWAEYERQRATIVATLYFEQVLGTKSTTKRRPS